MTPVANTLDKAADEIEEYLQSGLYAWIAPQIEKGIELMHSLKLLADSQQVLHDQPGPLLSAAVAELSAAWNQLDATPVANARKKFERLICDRHSAESN